MFFKQVKMKEWGDTFYTRHFFNYQIYCSIIYIKHFALSGLFSIHYYTACELNIDTILLKEKLGMDAIFFTIAISVHCFSYYHNLFYPYYLSALFMQCSLCFLFQLLLLLFVSVQIRPLFSMAFCSLLLRAVFRVFTGAISLLKGPTHASGS